MLGFICCGRGAGGRLAARPAMSASRSRPGNMPIYALHLVQNLCRCLINRSVSRPHHVIAINPAFNCGVDTRRSNDCCYGQDYLEVFSDHLLLLYVGVARLRYQQYYAHSIQNDTRVRARHPAGSQLDARCNAPPLLFWIAELA